MSVFTNAAASSAAEAAAYIRAVLDLLGDDDPAAVLAATPAALRKFVADSPEPILSAPETPGKWSARAVLRHLADSEIVWSWRLRMVLAHDRPPLTGYDQDAWADRLGYATADVQESLLIFDTLRAANLRMLAAQPPAALQRAGVHDERGEESVAHMMRLFAGHDLLHLRQLARIRDAVTAH